MELTSEQSAILQAFKLEAGKDERFDSSQPKHVHDLSSFQPLLDLRVMKTAFAFSALESSTN
jgi:hypothetical protein